MITAWEAKIDHQGFGLWAEQRAEDMSRSRTAASR